MAKNNYAVIRLVRAPHDYWTWKDEESNNWSPSLCEHALRRLAGRSKWRASPKFLELRVGNPSEYDEDGAHLMEIGRKEYAYTWTRGDIFFHQEYVYFLTWWKDNFASLNVEGESIPPRGIQLPDCRYESKRFYRFKIIPHYA